MNDSRIHRPNILFITSDQQRGDCYGFEGRRVKTPHLDRLAAEGTRFSACITPNVVCQPSRASILTGLLPMTHGVHDNGISLDPRVGEAGFIGKAHFSTYNTFEPSGSPENIESSRDYGPGWTGPYMGFGHVELMLIGHNWFPIRKPPEGQHFERWYHADDRGDEKTDLYWGDYRETGGPAAQTWNSNLPEAWHNSAWVGDRTIDFIDKNRPADGPGTAPWTVARPGASGPASRTRIIRSTRRSPDAACTIPTRSTCPNTGPAISIAGPGGTGTSSRRRSRASSRRSAANTAAFRTRATSSSAI